MIDHIKNRIMSKSIRKANLIDKKNCISVYNF